MKKLIIILFLSFTLYGCTNIEGPDLEKIMSENNYTIVDVRTKDEYDESHIVDSVNIPVDEIDENVNLDKDNIIFVYCRSGNRSSIALNILEDLGYKVYDLGAFSEINLPKE